MATEVFKRELLKLVNNEGYREDIKYGAEVLPAEGNGPNELTAREMDCLEDCGKKCGHIPLPGPGHPVPPPFRKFRDALRALANDVGPDGLKGYQQKVINGTASLGNDWGVTDPQQAVLEEAGKCAGHPI